MNSRLVAFIRRGRAGAALALVGVTACSNGGGPIVPVVDPAVSAVAVSPGTGSILVGATTTFVSTVTAVGGASTAVQWSSSNPAVASVAASGNTVTVTGVSAGTATITATSTFNAARSASATVTVTAPQTINLNPSSRTFTAAQGGALPASQTVAITASTGTINGLLGNITLNQGSGWLSATFTGGSSTPTTMTLSILTTALTPGTYTGTIVIGAAGVSTSATINVTYTVTAPAGGGQCTTASATTNIGLGQRATGTLANTDCTVTGGTAGTFADQYRLVLATTTVVQIDLSNDALTTAITDPFLILTDANGAIITTDDDGGIDTDAQIVRTLTAGTYFIRATTFGTADVGAYALLVGTSNGTGAMCAIANAVTINIGFTTAGAIANTDCFGYSDASFGDIYRFTRTNTSTVAFTMTSTAVNPWLRLLDNIGDQIAEDDNSGGGTSARISQSLVAGTYFLIATTAVPGTTGAYSITSTATAAAASLQAVPDAQLPPKVRAALRRQSGAGSLREYVKRWQ